MPEAYVCVNTVACRREGRTDYLFVAGVPTERCNSSLVAQVAAAIPKSTRASPDRGTGGVVDRPGGPDPRAVREHWRVPCGGRRCALCGADDVAPDGAPRHCPGRMCGWRLADISSSIWVTPPGSRSRSSWLDLRRGRRSADYGTIGDGPFDACQPCVSRGMRYSRRKRSTDPLNNQE